MLTVLEIYFGTRCHHVGLSRKDQPLQDLAWRARLVKKVQSLIEVVQVYTSQLPIQLRDIRVDVPKVQLVEESSQSKQSHATIFRYVANTKVPKFGAHTKRSGSYGGPHDRTPNISVRHFNGSISHESIKGACNVVLPGKKHNLQQFRSVLGRSHLASIPNLTESFDCGAEATLCVIQKIVRKNAEFIDVEAVTQKWVQHACALVAEIGVLHPADFRRKLPPLRGCLI